MGFREIYYPETEYGGFTKVDGTIAFYMRVNALLRPDFTVLDYGCGRGEYQSDPVLFRRNLRIIQGKVNAVIGVDPDPSASSNPYLDTFHLMDGQGKWPLDDNSIDLCLCDWVLEHVQEPKRFFSEAKRVIRKGGYLCIRTSNKWSYPSIFSRLIPERFHSNILTSVQNERKDEDIFPAYYKCNTKRKISENLDSIGFSHCVYTHESEPSYLESSRILYFLGVLYRKIVPPFFASTIIAFARKE